MIEDENFSITITYRAEDVENRWYDYDKTLTVAECVSILKRIKADHEYEFRDGPSRTLTESENYNGQLPFGLLDGYIESRKDAAERKAELKNAIWTDKYNKKRKTK